MWLTANWPFVVMAIVIIGAITYLFKVGAIGKAEIEVGAKGATAKLKLQSKERQIKEKDFDSISLNEFYADSDIGFVIHKPLSEEWTIRKLSLKEVYKEKGFAEEAIGDLLDQISANIRNPNENIHNLVIRRGTAHSVRYTEETVVDGHQLDLEILKQVLPRLEEIGYDQIYINAAKKDSMKSKWSLLQFFLGELQSFRPLNPKRLHVNPENTIFLLDCSVLFEKIEYDGKVGDHVINHMALFQENNEYFFTVIVAYAQAADKPTKVWDELRDYLNSFRVLVK